MYAYVILKVMQAVLWVIDRLICTATGYSLTRGSKEERSRSDRYESSAHVVKILYRDLRNGDWDIFNYQSDWNKPKTFMLCLHGQYCHPSCVLQDNISLFGVSKDTAHFAVTPPHLDVYSSDVNPFLVCAQFWNMTHLISMPIASFHRVAGEVGEPRSQVFMLSHTGRCGSTLAVQCFEALPNTRALSEPQSLLDALHLHSTGMTSDEENRKIIRSSIMVLCKETKRKNIKRILIKPTSIFAQFLSTVNSSCRFMRHVFMFRHPEKYVLSFLAIFKANPMCTRRFFVEANLIPNTGNYKWKSKGEIFAKRSMYELITFNWALICSCYLKYCKKGVRIKSFGYEELVKKPYETVSSLFTYLDIPNELVSRALTALKKDSQRNSFISQRWIQAYKEKCLTPDERRLVDGVLQKFSFPSVSEYSSSCLELWGNKWLIFTEQGVLKNQNRPQPNWTGLQD